ncbi:KamA family radical SAM protein [Desulfococcus sp.]|uniref:KamA family radical SAM protein n=1 Tax=Desulfococcus sp. TaxID=2025834 RepID=UPI003D14C5E3
MMNDRPWQDLLAESVTSADELCRRFPVARKTVLPVIDQYPMRINPYFLSLIREPGDPIWRQAIPDPAELEDTLPEADPLAEEAQSPVPGLIHRYPDRVVFLVSSQCALFCRHCMRKRQVGKPNAMKPGAVDNGIAYIQETPAIRDVILSGGDPFLLSDDHLIEDILKPLRGIPHVEILRIHTRIPCTLPQRITEALVRRLKAFAPLYINIQFNHPAEITPNATQACARLADAGIPLGCQTVLLKGVNDSPVVMRRLMQKLLAIRVRPYYIHQGDLVKGTGHFRTSVREGLDIMSALRGHTSGMCVPQYMIDLPGGGGKIPLLPEYVIEKRHNEWYIQTFDNRIVAYPVSNEGRRRN